MFMKADNDEIIYELRLLMKSLESLTFFSDDSVISCNSKLKVSELSGILSSGPIGCVKQTCDYL